MKLFTLLLPFLAALPLAITARPASLQQQQQQQALALSPPSSVNSFSTSNSDLESNSDLSSKSSKFSLGSFLKKTATFSSSSSGEFKCHRYPQTSILSELSEYITSVLRRNRDTILGGKGGQQLPPFKTCYAGVESTDLSESIYFSDLKGKQSSRVEELLRNQMNQILALFPGVEVVTTKDAIALVVKGRRGIGRRNTI